MPLPDRVIEQLGRESSGTPGWAFGALLFSGGILFITVGIYFGLVYGYEPYLQTQLSTVQNQANALSQSISTSDQSQLISFYSRIANLQTLLSNHTFSSQIFPWIEKNTEANVYYQSISFSASGDQVTLTGVAATEGDVNQQIAIFENSPQVQSVTVSGLNAPQLGGTNWTFGISLVMNPSIFAASNQ